MPRNSLLAYRGDEWRVVSRKQYETEMQMYGWDYVAARYGDGSCSYWPDVDGFSLVQIRLILAALNSGGE